ncbi:D-alanyl-D-alanine carboxypeptidase/D-alanyl-D-alanine-endopeptidase [Actinomadura sp. HBU206391]|uniref:D-alanyl-D-alanine carboxypeptidase/D-alanyl-D-alanine endopeptidase n=1 Tax=Actinomadura sp. HBU206391 TaxID=2731692 RepID=UPI00164EFDD6|nr:D-alanyl-D-alanine carboxypeptidase/D-alanyl-D-alanine-endopeptidase [Actinomadura sp. HBU206391]MBC6462876.1 D-alanyl-D-alanine carboxypeptidase/D-alanyl-D-alanine-endopeptidase [Actinomadura sp. HBU206391]
MRRSMLAGLAIVVTAGVSTAAAVASATEAPGRAAAGTSARLPITAAAAPHAAESPRRVAGVGRPQPGGGLAADLDAILGDARLNGAKIGVVVRDARTGKGLYTRGADDQVMPASNQKLQTAAAAFGVLGPGYTFRTSVLADGPVEGATLTGDVILKGTGDPTLQAADYDRLAAAVAAKGITSVTGRLVADDTWFDDQRLAAGWDPADEPYAYASQVSALTVSPDADFNVGTVRVDVTPGPQGGPVDVALAPATGHVTIDNRATTGAPGSASTLSITRPRGTDIIRVTGSYPLGGAKVQTLRTVDNPSLYAADVFRRALTAHGVSVAGSTARAAAPPTATTVTDRTSMPLSRLSVPFLKLSNNNIAEILVKAMGREDGGEGSWQAGLPVVARYVKTLGVDTTRLNLTDGSGLSRSNRATPAQAGNLLRGVMTKTWYPAFYNSLPIAGQTDPWVGGTLAARMTNTAAAGNVRAKTGTLTGATALSGYVRDPAGRRLIFSIMLNDYTGAAPKDLEDKIAIRLATGKIVERATVLRAPGHSLHVRPGAEVECSWIGAC